jgi:hypothetical protein
MSHWPQPLTAFPQSLPVHLLCSDLPARRHRFRPRPTTQTPGQVLPTAFPRRAARGTGWSWLRCWRAASACQPTRAGRCTAMPGPSSVPTSPIRAAVCRMPCHVCACAGGVRRCARCHVQPPPRRVSFTQGLTPLLHRAAAAWSPRPGNPVQLHSDTSVRTIRAAPHPPHATSGRPVSTLVCTAPLYRRQALASATPMPSHPICGTTSANIKGFPLPLALTAPHQPSSSCKRRLLPCFPPLSRCHHRQLTPASTLPRLQAPKELPVEAYLTIPPTQHLIHRSSLAPLSHR